MSENVAPGTKIVTEQRRAYEKALNQMPEYEHITINHSINFVDPNIEKIHTQNIEGLWSRINIIKEKKGISKSNKAYYLA